jgi:asparagine synthase (glutamine-hydrolysing)
MCGLILSKGYELGQTELALAKMNYRGKDGKQGISQRGGWTLGHVRLAIQDLSDKSNQPLNCEDYSLAYVGELFGLGGANELETVSQAYFKKGPEGFQNFDGFWAIAAAYDEGQIEVFTDYLSQKPLYFWPEAQIICSELDPMFELRAKPEIDRIYLANVIKFGYDCTGRTPYTGIIQLPPGIALSINSAGMTSSYNYWDWDKVPNPPLRELENELTKATLDRLVGDRPVALLISGGLDSSIIYSILSLHNKLIDCFSIENGETEYLPLGVFLMEAKPVELSKVLKAMQCPVDLGSMVPQYQLAEVLKTRGYNVCLSGDGADELFGGYNRAKTYDSQFSDIFMELPYYHLPRLDRLMMRHTVELRTPFLSPVIVRMALSIPYELRTEKQALKTAFRGRIHSDILNRSKHPLKTKAVIDGSISYRKNLTELFSCF